MKYATNNIYSIMLMACSGMMIPVLSFALLAWASTQFFGWEPAHPINHLGWVCLLSFVLMVAPAVAAVFLGFVLGPAEAAEPTA